MKKIYIAMMLGIFPGASFSFCYDGVLVCKNKNPATKMYYAEKYNQRPSSVAGCEPVQRWAYESAHSNVNTYPVVQSFCAQHGGILQDVRPTHPDFFAADVAHRYGPDIQVAVESLG